MKANEAPKKIYIHVRVNKELGATGHGKKITINRTLAESICKYCEDHAIYDKLGRYDDFYYKIKCLLK